MSMEDRLKGLAITEENDEGFEFTELGEEQPATNYELCLVGTFVMNRTLNFNVMKHRMACIWQPGCGMVVKDLRSKLILFRFYHPVDVKKVLDGGPWSFDNHLLLLHELKQGDDPMDIPLYLASFWVQVHDLTLGFFSEVVGKALGNYIGTFLEYDKRNVFYVDRPYMRIRVSVDIRQPLKKGKKVKKPGSEWIVCKFQYERLPSFCFIYGMIGHIDRNCVKIYHMPETEIVKGWDVSLRAPSRRGATLGDDEWLKEEEERAGRAGGRGAAGLTQRGLNKETTSASENQGIVTGSKFMQNLSGNFGANPHNIWKFNKQDFVEKNQEDEGIEITEERKKRRGDDTGNQRSAMNLDKKAQSSSVGGGHDPKNMVPAGLDS
ncbi:hypothetical protein PTKIN_Ptkin10aG0126500 [Pterospermum kingtungense]